MFLFQVLDLKDVELVYGTSFYKSLETGGNVSPALVMMNNVHVHIHVYVYVNVHHL